MLTLNDGRKELYQWDTGRAATVDIDCDIVHFANLKYGESLAVEVKEGKVYIPNKLLMSGEPIHCWAFVKDDNGAYTKKEQTISVTKRAKPSDYVYTETEVITIKTAVENALEKAKESGDFKGDKGDQGEQGIQGIQGIPGEKGEKGDTGADGYTPQKGVDYFTPEDIAGLNIPSVDQTYNPDSENAQSGKAVNEAVAIEQKRSDNTFANALKSSKSGSAILIDDVSPLTHDMTVKISSDTVEDLTAVKVTRCGKNLLYNDTIISESTNPVKKKIWSGNLPAPFVFSEDLSQFTPTEELASAATFRFKFADGTERVIGKDYKYLLVTTGILKEIYFVNNSEGIGTIKCQLEIGKVKTDYEPYVGTDYTPNADGTVNDVTSLYPNTTLTTDTDGVIITCEYNKDINKFSGVDVDVPTKTSELINDSNFATQDYVDEEIANFDFIKIVTELPETGLINRTYFVPKSDPTTNDLYDEYMWVDGKWELIATKQIEVDLTNYYTKSEVDEKMVVDQTYDKNSQNAQSGKAVAEAVAPKLELLGVYELQNDITYNILEDASNYTKIMLYINKNNGVANNKAIRLILCNRITNFVKLSNMQTGITISIFDNFYICETHIGNNVQYQESVVSRSFIEYSGSKWFKMIIDADTLNEADIGKTFSVWGIRK